MRIKGYLHAVLKGHLSPSQYLSATTVRCLHCGTVMCFEQQGKEFIACWCPACGSRKDLEFALTPMDDGTTYLNCGVWE